MGEANVGISVFDLDMQSGAFTQLQTVTGLRNPTYLALHPNLPILYAGERETTTWGPIEALAGNITTLAIGSDGELSIVSRLPIGAVRPMSVSTPQAGTFLPPCLVRTPWPCSPLARTDASSRASTLIQHQGRGVNSITLERPFPHCIRPDASGTRVLACDMGLDRLMVYDLDQTTGRLAPTEHPFAQLSSGAVPRHLWIHPSNSWVYVVNEMDATVSAFSYDVQSSAMRIISTTSTRPEGFAGHTTGAQIVVHPSGRFLYSSIRGHNSIAAFSIDADTGRPMLIELISSQGLTPRNFHIDPSGEFMVVANVASNNVVSFRIDPSTGRLSPTGHSMSSHNPVCVDVLRRRASQPLKIGSDFFRLLGGGPQRCLRLWPVARAEAPVAQV